DDLAPASFRWGCGSKRVRTDRGTQLRSGWCRREQPAPVAHHLVHVELDGDLVALAGREHVPVVERRELGATGELRGERRPGGGADDDVGVEHPHAQLGEAERDAGLPGESRDPATAEHEGARWAAHVTTSPARSLTADTASPRVGNRKMTRSTPN